MKRFFYTLFLIATLSACRTNRTRHHLREGRWVERTHLDTLELVSKGRYRHDEEVGTWRYYTNGKLSRLEVYKDGIGLVRTFHANGKVASLGHTRSELTETGRHWFYFGDWNYYDTMGQLTSIAHYENGELTHETPFD